MAKDIPLKDCRIVVLQRGWVVVGEYEEHGDRFVIKRAKNIRRWGTTQGLGELVNGPLPDTVLDMAGTVKGHVLGCVMTFDANPEKWQAHL